MAMQPDPDVWTPTSPPATLSVAPVAEPVARGLALPAAVGPGELASPPVLLVGNVLSAITGTRAVCEDLAERLRAAGWSASLTSARRNRAARLLDIVQTVWRQRHRYAVAHVDVYSGAAFVWAEAACWTLRRADKPYVLTLHGGALPAFARRHPARVRRLLASASAVTTPSYYALEAMRPYRSDLRLLPNPLDITAYPFRLRASAEPRLVWLRAFGAVYNPPMAVKVLAELVRSACNATLVMVGPDTGDGSLAETLRVAERLGVRHRLSLPGRVPKSQVPLWLSAGDVFLNTTNVDNTPVSVLEAMACGLCVVSTDAGGLPYLLQNGKHALLVSPGDVEGMAHAVRRVLSDAGTAAQLSRNARSKAEASDWSIVLPQWEALLRSAAWANGHRQKARRP